jgi:hypothetical protein
LNRFFDYAFGGRPRPLSDFESRRDFQVAIRQNSSPWRRQPSVAGRKALAWDGDRRARSFREILRHKNLLSVGAQRLRLAAAYSGMIQN